MCTGAPSLWVIVTLAFKNRGQRLRFHVPNHMEVERDFWALESGRIQKAEKKAEMDQEGAADGKAFLSFGF